MRKNCVEVENEISKDGTGVWDCITKNGKGGIQHR
jgi:hypothetical protein